MSSTPVAEPTTTHVNAQLRDLERQGGGMARLAHIAAGLLLVAFSAGSLLSISHAAFLAFLAQWDAGRLDVPDGISLVVNLLLVLAADVALLYAASVLRVLVAAQAPAAERRVHTWAMVGASLLESSTYLYLAWQFDHPTTPFLWLIVIARAFAAPLFAAYLSMARPLPVAPRDVAYQAALASGKGVVRDVATLAADSRTSLARKVRIYRASSLMSAADRVRFDNIVEAVSSESNGVEPFQQLAPVAVRTAPATPGAAPVTGPAMRHGREPDVIRSTLDPPPDGSGEPPPPASPSSPPLGSNLRREPGRASGSGNVTPLRRGMGRPPRQDRKTTSRANARSGRRGQAQQRVYALLHAEPEIEFESLVARANVSRSTASKWREAWQTEQRATGVVAQQNLYHRRIADGGAPQWNH